VSRHAASAIRPSVVDVRIRRAACGTRDQTVYGSQSPRTGLELESLLENTRISDVPSELSFVVWEPPG
jgi:hypothetical protein